MNARTLLLAALLCPLLAAGCGDGATGSPDAREDDRDDKSLTTPGGGEVKAGRGEQVLSASATVTVGGEDHKLTGGQCVISPEAVTVLIGPGSERSLSVSLGRVAGVPGAESAEPVEDDGQYKDALVAATIGDVPGGGGIVSSEDATVTLSDDRTRGEFTAKAADGKPVTGTFACE